METIMNKFKISIHKTRAEAISAMENWIARGYNEADMEIDFELSTGLYALYIPAED
jgi:hypothetical protein